MLWWPLILMKKRKRKKMHLCYLWILALYEAMMLIAFGKKKCVLIKHVKMDAWSYIKRVGTWLKNKK